MLVGVWCASSVARDLAQKDPQVVVIDEVAGFLVTMVGASATVPAIVAGFVLFRIMDIAKPWPIRCFERLPSGWGIVLDDVVAGGLAAAAMAGLRAARWLP
jgi:phosphatidylglycerophosphatase A